MNSEEKLEQSTIVKERGTVYFKEGKYKQALLQYKKIISWLEYESSSLMRTHRRHRPSGWPPTSTWPCVI